MGILNKSIYTLEFDKIKEELSKFAKTEQTKALCKNIKIFEQTQQIQEQLNYTAEAKKILDFARDIPINEIISIQKLKQSLIQSYLDEEELVNISKTLRTSRLVKKFISENTNEDDLLKKLSISLFVNKNFEDIVYSTIDESYNIKQDATPELKRLYASLKDNEQNLRDEVNKLLSNSSFTKYLQDNIYTQRDERIVFQVMASNKTKVPGIVHDVSSSAKTFYIEPAQLVPLNNKIREIKSQIYSENIKILTSLTNQVKQDINYLANTEQTLAKIDFHFAKARYAVSIKAIQPELNSDGYINFENMKHPLLLKTGKDVIANNFEIGKDYHSIIITGSNTGGKTVTLKTIGLFLLMTKSGMFLPCTFASVHPFKKIVADIGDAQNILQNLSTFSSHITNIKEILDICDSETFVLLDEICAGTDPIEGAVLAKCILEKLYELKSTSVITTHYGELKVLEYKNQYFKNASVEFNTETFQPTYKLLIGIPGLSNAISIASNLGINSEIISKAKNILLNQKDISIDVVEKLQETHTKLSKDLKQAKELKESSLNIKLEYEENLNKIKKDKKKTLKNIKNKFDHEMLEARAQIKEILEELRKEKSEKIARRAYSRLALLEDSYNNEIDNLSDKNTYIEIDWNKVKIGDNLMLKEMHQKVTVLSLPDKNKKLFVDMGNLKMKIKTEELAVLDDKFMEPKKLKYGAKQINNFELKRIEMSSTLDLRGYRVEEALDEVEVYLDKASLVNLTPVYIIHGHGTGALKDAVREFLKTSPYVAKFRAGKNSEGGDGVSIVDIN